MAARRAAAVGTAVQEETANLASPEAAAGNLAAAWVAVVATREAEAAAKGRVTGARVTVGVKAAAERVPLALAEDETAQQTAGAAAGATAATEAGAAGAAVTAGLARKATAELRKSARK